MGPLDSHTLQSCHSTFKIGGNKRKTTHGYVMVAKRNLLKLYTNTIVTECTMQLYMVEYVTTTREDNTNTIIQSRVHIYNTLHTLYIHSHGHTHTHTHTHTHYYRAHSNTNHITFPDCGIWCMGKRTCWSPHKAHTLPPAWPPAWYKSTIDHPAYYCTMSCLIY